MTDDVARSGRARVVACPHCGGSVTVRAAGSSITVICPSCGSTLDVADATLRLVAAAQALTRKSVIPLGARGTLGGTEWEVIGYQIRSSEGGSWEWAEYLLFNPYRGFRFLAHDHGHWTLYCMLRDDVGDPLQSAGKHRFRLEFEGEARVEYVLGEFYWRVQRGQTVAVKDYAAAPYILSQERTSDEVTWSRGIYLEPALVQSAFRLGALPARATVVAHQPPARGTPGPKHYWAFAALFITLLILLSNMPLSPFDQRSVISFHVDAVADDRNHPVATDPFDIPGDGGSLALELHTSMVNDWVQVDLSLVDQASDRSFSGTVAAQSYSGTDSDGPWSEGSADDSITFASVPPGRYRLLVTTDAGAFTHGDPAHFDVTVRRHPGSAFNFWAALSAMLIMPVGHTLRRRRVRA